MEFRTLPNGSGTTEEGEDRGLRPESDIAGSRSTEHRHNEAAFLHRSLKPLDEVAFKGDDPNQISLFDNECEGICGV